MITFNKELFKKSSIILIFLALLICSGGCNFKEREEQIKKKNEELVQKEQQLILWEKNLQLKEDSINRLMQRTDSSHNAIDILPQNIVGDWTAKMVCTETNCPGSAIGDTQTDNWQISTRDSSVIIASVTRGQINRVYTGHYFKNNTIQVSIQSEHTGQAAQQGRVVEITEIRDNKMKGTRVVTQTDGCQIKYSLELDKKQ